MDTLGKRPDLKNYKGEVVSQKNIEVAYANTVYGSSIYQPIGTQDSNGLVKRDKKNNLEEDIKKMPIRHLYGGGFYCIRSLYVSEGKYCDVWILVEQIEDLENVKKIKLTNDLP